MKDIPKLYSLHIYEIASNLDDNIGKIIEAIGVAIPGEDLGGFPGLQSPPPHCHFNIILDSSSRLRRTNHCISWVLLQYRKKTAQS